jgi:uncharacterized protein (DUF2141 family)
MSSARLAILAIALTALTVTGQPASAFDIPPQDAPVACTKQRLQIKAVVSGATAQGLLTVELYRPSEKDFLRKASRIKRTRLPATAQTQTVCFDLPGPGRYALAAYHDLDADGKLARRLNMLPAEPFALSRGQVEFLRFPQFDDAAVEVGPDGAAVPMTLQKK